MKKLLLFFLILLCVQVSHAQNKDTVTKVYVVFKTHLDVGFTDLSSEVTHRYVNDFIPKAVEVSEKLRNDRLGEHYVWTTGSWLIWRSATYRIWSKEAFLVNVGEARGINYSTAYPDKRGGGRVITLKTEAAFKCMRFYLHI